MLGAPSNNSGRLRQLTVERLSLSSKALHNIQSIMRRYNPDIHNRQSLRRADHDYAASGIYFVTINTHDRAPLLGTVRRYGIEVTDAGRMINREWNGLAKRFPGIKLDAFIIMPDHIHGILILPHSEIDASITLGRVIQAYKSLTTKRYSEGVREKEWPDFNGRLWHYNYNDRIIRSHDELVAKRKYIADNPRRRWVRDFGQEAPE
jgi:REP element-mobilizing transposase RayT